MEQGQFQIYTGDGKGKTTAAIGLAVRAAGAGLRVYIGQFIKDMEYSEVSVLRKAGIVVELYGTGKGCLIGKIRRRRTETLRIGACAEQVRSCAAKDMVWSFAMKSTWHFSFTC